MSQRNTLPPQTSSHQAAGRGWAGTGMAEGLQHDVASAHTMSELARARAMEATAILEAQLAAEMRLHVMESLVALLFATKHKATPDPAETVEVLRQALMDAALTQTYGEPGSPASVLVATHLENAIDAALNLQRAWLHLPAANLRLGGA